MNKNFKVITINGVRGVIAAVFIVLGLIAGFIISPGWVCMKLWNTIFQESNTVAMMNLIQGIMLWAIIALSLYALNNRRALIGFGSYQGLSPEQIRDIMDKTRQAENKILKEIQSLEEKNRSEVLSPSDIKHSDEIKDTQPEEMRK